MNRLNSSTIMPQRHSITNFCMSVQDCLAGPIWKKALRHGGLKSRVKMAARNNPMETPYLLIENLAGLIDTIKPNSIISRTFYKDDHLKAILFGFDTGQELSEHTASQAAIIQILQGEAAVT